MLVTVHIPNSAVSDFEEMLGDLFKYCSIIKKEHKSICTINNKDYPNTSYSRIVKNIHEKLLKAKFAWQIKNNKGLVHTASTSLRTSTGRLRKPLKDEQINWQFQNEIYAEYKLLQLVGNLP